jgi:hypothetical protein
MELLGSAVEEAAGDDLARERRCCVDGAEAGDAGVDEVLGRGGVGQVANAGHHFNRRAECFELGDQLGRGVAQHEVVAALSEDAGECGADVETGFGDEGDTA